jgi:hypothetical protein
MARKCISCSDLIWMFHERLSMYPDNPFHGIALAVVPEGSGGWEVVTQKRLPTRVKRDPDLAARVRTIEKQLKQKYKLVAR